MHLLCNPQGTSPWWLDPTQLRVQDVVERYPWTGEDVVHKRRDKRPGHHTGKVVRTKEGAEIQYAYKPNRLMILVMMSSLLHFAIAIQS